MIKQLKINTLRKKVLILIKLFALVILVSFIILDKVNYNSDIMNIIMIAIIFVAAVLLDRAICILIVNPINKLTEITDAINSFNNIENNEVVSKDEIGQLSISLNRMLENLKKENSLLEKEYEHEKELLLQWKTLIENLSHRMKTPLSIIKAHAIGIIDDDDKMRTDKYAKVIEDEVEILNEMIKSLLKLSELETGISNLKLEVFDIVELVEIVTGRLLFNTVSEKINLTYELPDEKMMILADYHMIENVIENLVINAINYSTGNRDLDINIINKNNNVLISIYNETEQLSQEELIKIWDKFYQKSPNDNKQGSGLGLAIVKTILELHNIVYYAENYKKGIKITLLIKKHGEYTNSIISL